MRRLAEHLTGDPPPGVRHELSLLCASLPLPLPLRGTPNP
jgi:hypothetical protein